MEFGIANEMEQYDSNIKVRQLLGDNYGSSSKKNYAAASPVGSPLAFAAATAAAKK